MRWVFEESDPMGGPTGEAYRDTLQASGIPPVGVLSREAIQNSVDAELESVGSKVKVVFRRRSLTGSEKAQFVDWMDLDKGIARRRDHLEFRPSHGLDDLADPNTPLELLYIEDFGTHGLSGNPRSTKSHFHKLLLQLGGSGKKNSNKSTGGSYGYGKAVYFAASRIFTVVAHSVFDPAHSGEDRDVYARLLGCSFFNQHFIGEKELTGRAWYGNAENGDARVVSPIENEDAGELAGNLGFLPRGKGDTGTSMLIIDCGASLDELLASVEKWWWPRLIDQDLTVEITDGVDTLRPRVQKRQDLKPFIDSYFLAQGLADPVGNHQRSGQFNKLNNVPLGSYGLSLVEEDPSEEIDEELLNSVALMRKPRMVVEYWSHYDSAPRYAGVVVAADEIDKSLKLSEPASHNRWDPRSDRFEDVVQQNQVESLMNRIPGTVKRFLNDAMPPSAEEGEFRLTELERMLGTFFKLPTTKPGPPTGGKADPISLHFKDGPTFSAVEDRLKVAGTCQITLDPQADREVLRARVVVVCQPEEEGGHGTKEPIGIHLYSDHFVEAEQGRILELKVNEPRTVTFSSDPYPPDWTVEVEVSVEEVA